MKICFISTLTADPWGGCEELWAATARYALAGGHEVSVCVVRWPELAGPVADLGKRGARIFQYQRLNTRWGRMRHRVGYRPFAPLTKLDFDVICISQSGSHDIALFHRIEEIEELTKGFRIPYILICQLTNDWGFLPAHVFERANRSMEKAAAVCFVSDHNRLLTQRHLARDLPNGRVVRNPVNLSSTDSVPWPENSKAIFCAPARLDTAHKGQDILLTALTEPRWRDRDWELWLCGKGRDEEYLQRLVAYYGLEERVKFQGHKNDIRKLWGAAHLLVMASRYEGTPLALVEAMLCGRPGVVTDVGGNAEWITEGVSGFVAPAATSASFGAALDRAWGARERWPIMGQAARDEAIKRYDPQPEKTIFDLMFAATQSPKLQPA